MTTTRRLAAILAADVAGYSAMMERDEEGTFARVRALRRDVIEPKLAEHQGRLIKTTGDGFLAEFASPIAALKSALSIQASQAGSDALQLRIGLNLGDVIIEDGDVYGEGVNVAARLEALAEPGGILVSDKIHREVEGKIEAIFEDRGEQQVKNIAKPVRAYSVLTGAASNSRSSPILEPGKPLPLPDKPSIAVLPFQNMSGDPEQEYFADGMVEDIITALSRFKSLFVIARNSSFTYKGKAVDIKQVGRELGVRYVLEGSVRKAGGRVRITGQLIEAATNNHLWADRFDGTLDDVFELQDRVTSKVVGAVTPTVEKAEIERAQIKATADLGAYDYYLRGITIPVRSPEDNMQALTFYQRAFELDPGFARAYGRAAWSMQSHWLRDWADDRPRVVAEGTYYANKAVALGQEDAEALALAAWFLAIVKLDLDRADRVSEQAVQLNPNLVMVRAGRGWISVRIGRHEEAIRQLEALIRLSPVDNFDLVNAYTALAAAYNHSGRADVGISWAERALAKLPNNGPALTNAIVASASLGDYEKARHYGQRYLAIAPQTTISRFREMVGFRRPQDMARVLDAFRQAGFPE